MWILVVVAITVGQNLK